jgi:hypothetical protein
VLKNPQSIAADWLPHYAALDPSYPGRCLLASGTHGDISPTSGNAARGFSESIARLNGDPRQPAKLVNATFSHFWKAMDEDLAKGGGALPTVRGCFGHSWELWPVSLARYVADLREGERNMLAAESLLAIAQAVQPQWVAAWTPMRREAEWNWAMLADHAWNGTNRDNQLHNAELRRRWSGNLLQLAAGLQDRAWSVLVDPTQRNSLVVFNSLSFPRSGLVCLPWERGTAGVIDDTGAVASQVVDDAVSGGQLCFVAREVPAFGFRAYRIERAAPGSSGAAKVQATASQLDGPFYRLGIDPQTGGIASLLHKLSGTEMVVGKGRSLAQTVYFDGQAHTLQDVRSEIVAQGPVLGRVRTAGHIGGIEVSTQFTIYTGLDQVDVDVRIHAPADTRQHRICQVFPIAGDGAVVRVATPGAVVRPLRQPAGDLLPGADLRRMAVQDFVCATTDDVTVTLAPLDAFALRRDLDSLSFEALGNDQNYKEVVKDQNGVTDFRFRYAIQARPGKYDAATTAVFARSAVSPFLFTYGSLRPMGQPLPTLAVDPTRAMATCLKPADDSTPGGVILRLQEVAGKTGPVQVVQRGYQRAVVVDLLERDEGDAPVRSGSVALELRGHGLSAVRLLP